MFALVSCLVGCSAAKQSAGESTAIKPQRDQVVFFERPLTLAVARNSHVPSPLAVLLVSDPWADVMGSDSPTFALYDDGTVIQRSARGFSTSRISEAEMTRLLARLNIRALSRSYGGFNAEDASDQPEQNLLIYQPSRPVFVYVYGSLNDPQVRSKITKEVVAAYDALKTFRHSPSEPWLPEYVEVMIAPYEYAPDPSIHWPKKWPGLGDPKTIRRGTDAFSIFVPSTELAQLRAFLISRKDRGAIEIDGRKWSASIRIPFPHEELWMAPNPELRNAEH